jgi:hypothetical protein
MKRYLPANSIWGALLLLGLPGMLDRADGGSFTRGCAARDLQILMLIEDQENLNAVPADRLSDAFDAMLEARIVCHEGRVVDAIALYDDIARSIAVEVVPARRK